MPTVAGGDCVIPATISGGNSTIPMVKGGNYIILQRAEGAASTRDPGSATLQHSNPCCCTPLGLGRSWHKLTLVVASPASGSLSSPSLCGQGREKPQFLPVALVPFSSSFGTCLDKSHHFSLTLFLLKWQLQRKTNREEAFQMDRRSEETPRNSPGGIR